MNHSLSDQLRDAQINAELGNEARLMFKDLRDAEAARDAALADVESLRAALREIAQMASDMPGGASAAIERRARASLDRDIS